MRAGVVMCSHHPPESGLIVQMPRRSQLSQSQHVLSSEGMYVMISLLSTDSSIDIKSVRSAWGQKFACRHA
jgi:hypothetical protein